MDPNVWVVHELGLAPFLIRGRVRGLHMSIHYSHLISN